MPRQFRKSDDIPDVFITPRFLELEFGFTPKDAYAIATVAKKLAHKRWPKAAVYVHVDSEKHILEDAYIFAFLSIDYYFQNAIGKDFNSEANDSGPYMEGLAQWEILQAAIQKCGIDSTAVEKATTFYTPRKKGKSTKG